jgi:hypothetical protein
MGAFARLQLALQDADDATVNLIFSVFAPPAPGKRAPSKRKAERALRLALALINSDRSHQFPQIQRGKADARQRPRKPGQSVKR